MGFPHYSTDCDEYHDVVFDHPGHADDATQRLVYGLKYRATLSSATLQALDAEAVRAHLKHVQPEHGGGSIFDPELPVLTKLSALGEEFGEVCRLLTYDGGRVYKLDDRERRQELMKELLQTANVALTWYQSLAGDEED